jgi:hypothetical protein
MNVRITQATKSPESSTRFWRTQYIKVLTEDLRPWEEMTEHERVLQLGVIEDLIVAGYMVGHVTPDTTGVPCAATTRGPTLAGRIFAEEQREILDKSSLLGRIKSGAGVAFGWFFGWMTGIISALIIWYITK